MMRPCVITWATTPGDMLETLSAAVGEEAGGGCVRTGPRCRHCEGSARRGRVPRAGAAAMVGGGPPTSLLYERYSCGVKGILSYSDWWLEIPMLLRDDFWREQ